MIRVLISVAVVSLLAACASPTPYQPAKNGYGYSQQQIEDNRYRVTFKGNDVTTLDTVDIYLLYRAAELTVQSDYDYFEIADRETDKSTRYWTTFSNFGRFGRHSRHFDESFLVTGIETGTSRPITQYGATANVLFFRGRKQADKTNAYDARDVLQRLGRYIKRPEPAQD